LSSFFCGIVMKIKTDQEGDSMSKLEHLFQPIAVGALELKNRIVMAPMNDSLAGGDGSVTDRMVRYYEERAKGGVGMIITGNAYVEEKKGRISAAQFGCFHDRLVPKLNFLAETIHLYDIPVIMQLVHAGRQADPNIIEGPPVAPSPLPFPATGVVPQELSIAEIEEIVEQFGRAAVRAKQAGFDGVEIHAAHGYLLSSFVSPATNRRTDKYGGGLEGRTGVVVDVIDLVRRLTGDGFVVGVRMNGMDGVEGGITVEDSPQIAKILEATGVDYLHVSAGMGHVPHLVQQSNHLDHGCLIPYAEAVKKEVKSPVIAVGSLVNPHMAEEVLKEERADLVALGRSLIADPDLPMKAKAGKFDDIRTCIRCNVCISRLYESRELACAVNPEVGREGQYPLTPVADPRRIMVVGGGPAGMETARTAGLRGHQVTLFEKSPKLGGVSLPKDNPPFKKELENIPRYYSGQLKKLNVKVRLGEKATPENIEEAKPDVVVIAEGGTWIVPEVPGIDSPHVVFAWDVLNKAAETGSRVVVIGAGLVGCEIALYLASQGKNVLLVTRRGRDGLAGDLNLVSRKALVEELEKTGVEVLENNHIHSVVGDGVMVENVEGKKTRIEVDTVVVARGLRPNLGMYNCVSDMGYEAYAIGDCRKPGDIGYAIREGYHLGRRL
jgi:2,4-dienoyl-CoA reductase-like NADH-dependent reductase (Old Yellow Enzyme family)/thioredoxin reductase